MAAYKSDVKSIDKALFKDLFFSNPKFFPRFNENNNASSLEEF
jgi:hypothetical protein